MRNILLIAADSVRSLMHRRLLLALMIVMLILTVIFSVVLSRISSTIADDPAQPAVGAVAEQEPPAAGAAGEQEPQSSGERPGTFQEILEQAQPPPDPPPSEQVRGDMQFAGAQLLSQFYGFAAFGGMIVALFIGATAVSGDVRSGAIAMILCRPVTRWQFLAGKFTGAMAVLLGYSMLTAITMVIFTQIHDLDMVPALRYAPWLMFCRNVIYASFALVLSVLMPSILAGILPVFLTGDWFFSLFSSGNPLHYLHFIFPTYAPFNVGQFGGGALMGGSETVILTVYALDLAVVFLLLAMWRFRSKPVTRS